MLSERLEEINGKKIILASGSPRRVSLLRGIGLNFEVIVSGFEENLDKTLYTPQEYVMENARLKAEFVSKLNGDADLVIGADTVVVHDGEILGKPGTVENAVAMLRKLQGATHSVLTGVALIGRDRSEVFLAETTVTFSPLSDVAIENYVREKLPLDKAGSYGIQEPMAETFVESIRGEFSNVIGLPINAFCRALLRFF